MLPFMCKLVPHINPLISFSDAIFSRKFCLLRDMVMPAGVSWIPVTDCSL